MLCCPCLGQVFPLSFPFLLVLVCFAVSLPSASGSTSSENNPCFVCCITAVYICSIRMFSVSAERSICDGFSLDGVKVADVHLVHKALVLLTTTEVLLPAAAN